MDSSVVTLGVDGVATSVFTAGRSGTETAVVFVHGNPGTGSDWGPIMRPVSEFARCVAPTMPGYGSTTPEAFDFTADGYATYLEGVLEALGVRQVHLVTHDLGGIWGLAWAARHPTRIASLTLMNIGVLPEYQWHRFARLYRVPLIGELVLALATRSSTRRALQAGGRRKIPEPFVEQVHRQYRNPGTRRAVLAFYRATDDLGAVTLQAASSIHAAALPTLVVWGAGDPYVPVRYAESQRQFFPQAEVVVLPDSGHWPLVDDPIAVSSAVVTFLRDRVAPTPDSGSTAAA